MENTRGELEKIWEERCEDCQKENFVNRRIIHSFYYCVLIDDAKYQDNSVRPVVIDNHLENVRRCRYDSGRVIRENTINQ